MTNWSVLTIPLYLITTTSLALCWSMTVIKLWFDLLFGFALGVKARTSYEHQMLLTFCPTPLTRLRGGGNNHSFHSLWCWLIILLPGKCFGFFLMQKGRKMYIKQYITPGFVKFMGHFSSRLDLGKSFERKDLQHTGVHRQFLYLNQ